MPTQIETRLDRLETLVRQLQGYDRWGSGDPNSVVDAPMGATYKRTDTAAVYRKTTTLGTLTGWVTP
jgi:hypothetical protein